MASPEDFREMLKRFRKPSNYGAIEDADVAREESDYSCGDRVKIFLKIQGERIVKATFTSEACLFCNASASVLTDLINGKTIEEALGIDEKYLLKRLNTDNKSPRYRCIVLPLRALKRGLQGFMEGKGP
ncbi:MAG: iron-sulfur cluster assembly scaffold protein [Thermoproteota archaeon]